MTELNVGAQIPDASVCPTAPLPLARVRWPAAGGGAADVSERDILAFDVAIAAAESGVAAPYAASQSVAPGARGSVAEMTAALDIYRNANAAAPMAAEPSPGGPAAANQPEVAQGANLNAVSEKGAVAVPAAAQPGRAGSAVAGELNLDAELASAMVAPREAAADASATKVSPDLPADTQKPFGVIDSNSPKAAQAPSLNEVIARLPMAEDTSRGKLAVASGEAAADASATKMSPDLPADTQKPFGVIDSNSPKAAQAPSLNEVIARLPMAEDISRGKLAVASGEAAADASATKVSPDLPADTQKPFGVIDSNSPKAAQAPSLNEVIARLPMAEDTSRGKLAVASGEAAAGAHVNEVITALPAARHKPSGVIELDQPESQQDPGLNTVSDEGLAAIQSAAAIVPVALTPATTAVIANDAPATSRFDVAQIVQQVNRELGRRDLAALDAGREIVLQLDGRILPQTVLTFRAARADGAAAASGDNVQVVVGLQTQSDEVRAFLDTHGQSLIDAMAREAPGLRWLPTHVDSPREAPAVMEAAAVVSVTVPVDAAQTFPAGAAAIAQNRDIPREPGPGSLEQSDQRSSGQQERGASSNPGHGQRGRQSAHTAFSMDDAAVSGAGSAAGWFGLTEAERLWAAHAPNDTSGGNS